MNLLEIEISQKTYIKVLCTCIFFVILILGFYYSSLLSCKEFTLEDSTTIVEFGKEKMNVHIDILAQQGKKVEIVGWAYKEDEEIRTINSNYVLKSRNTEKLYIVKTVHEKNSNVPEVYSRAGLHSRFLTGSLPSGTYDIYVLYKNNDNNYLAQTGIHIDI